MKKTILFALLSIAALSVAEAKKKAPKEAPKPVIELKSASDSVSYAAGYANTQGLIPFIQQQHKVDTAYMADFILGFKEIKDAFAVDTVKLRIRLRCRTRGLCIRRSCGLLCCRGSVAVNVLAWCCAGC